LPLRFRRRTDGIVEAIDANSSVAGTQARQRLDEPPWRARHDGGRSRVSIPLQQPQIQTHRKQALKPKADACPTVAQPRRATLPKATIGAQKLSVQAHDLVEVWAPDLLFALHDPTYRQRQLCFGVAKSANHGEPYCELGLIVGCATREEFPIAQRWLKRRRVPQIERVNRLNVIVVVQKQCVIAAPALLAIDRCRPISGTQLPRFETSGLQKLLDQLGRLIQLTRFRRHTRLTAEQAQDAQRVVLDPRVVHGHEADPMLW
jgi:hypothetical protein